MKKAKGSHTEHNKGARGTVVAVPNGRDNSSYDVGRTGTQLRSAVKGGAGNLSHTLGNGGKR